MTLALIPTELARTSHMLAERDVAESDYSEAAQALGKARERALVLEVANIAQIACENYFTREDELVIDATDRGAAYVESILRAAGETEDTPAWWSEDLIDFTFDEVREHYGYVETDGDRMYANIGAALEAEEKLVKSSWAKGEGVFFDRRRKARTELADGLTQAAQAASHMLMLEVLEVVPEARAVSFTYTPERDILMLEHVLDVDRSVIDDERTDMLDAYDHPLSNYAANEDVNFTAQHLIASGVATESPFDENGAVVVFDAVRRLRGVADDPMQPTLFGDDDPADYGWLGRAA